MNLSNENKFFKGICVNYSATLHNLTTHSADATCFVVNSNKNISEAEINDMYSILDNNYSNQNFNKLVLYVSKNGIPDNETFLTYVKKMLYSKTLRQQKYFNLLLMLYIHNKFPILKDVFTPTLDFKKENLPEITITLNIENIKLEKKNRIEKTINKVCYYTFYYKEVDDLFSFVNSGTLTYLTSGSFGDCFTFTHNNQTYILKIIEYLFEEVSGLLVNHLINKITTNETNIQKYICKIHQYGQFFTNEYKSFYSISDYCDENLYDFYMKQKYNCEYDKIKDCLHIIIECAKATKVIHDTGYIHCDIKLENFLIKKNNNNNDYTIKIIDFGFIKKNIINKTMNGTSIYMTPTRFSNSLSLKLQKLKVIDEIEYIPQNNYNKKYTKIIHNSIKPVVARKVIDAGSLCLMLYELLFNESVIYNIPLTKDKIEKNRNIFIESINKSINNSIRTSVSSSICKLFDYMIKIIFVKDENNSYNNYDVSEMITLFEEIKTSLSNPITNAIEK